MEFTESVKSFQVPATPFTSAWPPSLPSVPTSRATRVTSAAKERELVHHRIDGVLQLENFAFDIHRDFLRQGHHWPRRSSPRRCCAPGRSDCRPSNSPSRSRSFQVPATPFTSAWPPSLPSVPTSRATRVTSAANDESWSTIVLMVSLSSRISPLTSTVIFLESRRWPQPWSLRRCYAPGR